MCVCYVYFVVVVVLIFVLSTAHVTTRCKASTNNHRHCQWQANRQRYTYRWGPEHAVNGTWPGYTASYWYSTLKKAWFSLPIPYSVDLAVGTDIQHANQKAHVWSEVTPPGWRRGRGGVGVGWGGGALVDVVSSHTPKGSMCSLFRALWLFGSVLQQHLTPDWYSPVMQQDMEPLPKVQPDPTTGKQNTTSPSLKPSGVPNVTTPATSVGDRC